MEADSDEQDDQSSSSSETDSAGASRTMELLIRMPPPDYPATTPPSVSANTGAQRSAAATSDDAGRRAFQSQLLKSDGAGTSQPANLDGLLAAATSLQKAGDAILQAAAKLASGPELFVLRDT